MRVENGVGICGGGAYTNRDFKQYVASGLIFIMAISGILQLDGGSVKQSQEFFHNQITF